MNQNTKDKISQALKDKPKSLEHIEHFKLAQQKRIKEEGDTFPPGARLKAVEFSKGKSFVEMYGVERANNIKKKMSESRSGDKHYNWKGGITTLNNILRSKAKYRIWRDCVFLRDNFTCQNLDCKFCHNKIGVLLHPHHTKPVSLFPELAFRVDNGITYCAKFHLKSGLHKLMKKEVENGNVQVS